MKYLSVVFLFVSLNSCVLKQHNCKINCHNAEGEKNGLWVIQIDSINQKVVEHYINGKNNAHC